MGVCRSKIEKTEFEKRAQALLADGSIRLLSSKWLLKQREDYKIQRCQDLPEKAFVKPKAAAKMLRKRGSLLVLSYPWLSKTHPDPRGFHISTLRCFLTAYRDDGFTECGIFWDFASLPQVAANGTPLSESEKQIFNSGLKGINLLYGAPLTMVIQLTQMPQDSKSADAKLVAYDLRGWCFFEATVASIVKPPLLLLDLNYIDWDKIGPRCLTGDAGPFVYAETINELKKQGSITRRPPLRPETMVEALRPEKRSFTNGADRDIVANKYAEFFQEVAASPTELFLGGEHWGDAEFAELSKALPFFVSCEIFHLISSDSMSHHAWESLAEALPNMKQLKCLNLDECAGMGEQGITALCARLPELTALKQIYLPRQLMTQLKDTAEFQTFQKTCKDHGKDVQWTFRTMFMKK